LNPRPNGSCGALERTDLGRHIIFRIDDGLRALLRGASLESRAISAGQISISRRQLDGDFDLRTITGASPSLNLPKSRINF
jgi:hypothetical protein